MARCYDAGRSDREMVVGAALSAFAVVFAAELGDRTQLLVLALATRHRPLTVLVSVTLGYAVTNLLAVLVGGLVGDALPRRPVELAAGAILLVAAVWLWRAADDEDEHEVDGVPGALAAGGPRLVAVIAGSVVLAELGDKSMLATATLATANGPVPVWAGATAAVVASSALALLLGRWLAEHVPLRRVRRAGAVVFAVVGIAMLAGVG